MCCYRLNTGLYEGASTGLLRQVHVNSVSGRVWSTGHENWHTCRNTCPVPLPFCPPQNPHELSWNWKWASAVRGQWKSEPQHSLHTTYCGRCCIYPHIRQIIFPLINHLKNWQSPYNHAQLNIMCTCIVCIALQNGKGLLYVLFQLILR